MTVLSAQWWSDNIFILNQGLQDIAVLHAVITVMGQTETTHHRAIKQDRLIHLPKSCGS